MNPFILSDLLLWVVVVVQSIFIIMLLNKTTKFLSRLLLVSGIQIDSKLKIGDIAPLSRGTTHNNEKINLSKMIPGDINFLLFVKESCSICSDVITNIMPILDKLEEPFKLTIIQIGNFDEEKTDFFNSFNNINYIKSDNMIRDFEITKAPTIIIYDKDKIIKSIDIIYDVHQLKDVLLTKTKRPLKKIVS